MDYQLILVAVLSGGLVSAVLGYFTAKRANKTTYMESVADTLSEFNDRLKSELREVREELDSERRLRRQEVNDLTSQLIAERTKNRELEARVSRLERE
jgi:septal ring factor EnvC (AmiA/AmiB activator)